MAWDVTVADTYAESHLAATALAAGAAADKAAANKEMKYSALFSFPDVVFHSREFRNGHSHSQDSGVPGNEVYCE